MEDAASEQGLGSREAAGKIVRLVQPILTGTRLRPQALPKLSDFTIHSLTCKVTAHDIVAIDCQNNTNMSASEEAYWTLVLYQTSKGQKAQQRLQVNFVPDEELPEGSYDVATVSRWMARSR
ncbi:hypothetical protein C2W62_10315 [Candidatus Entotheonella serta]|nr:hypothetical protein C2W62_10315 [Candidatus Entotheonella serta]